MLCLHITIHSLWEMGPVFICMYVCMDGRIDALLDELTNQLGQFQMC